LLRYIETPARELNVPVIPTIKEETPEMSEVSGSTAFFFFGVLGFSGVCG
jgi:hypothetical protein